MARPPRVLAMIMAGGKGERLSPLTRERSKPAVPFGGRHRIVDFVLSNFLNSNVLALYVLVQYKSQSLIEHVRLAWRTTGILPDAFVTIVPPQMRFGNAWYRGTADAVLQNLNLIDDFAPDVIAVFGADHIYRMDVSQMVDYHLDQKADVTIAARQVPIGSASEFGVLAVNPQGRIVRFDEKPPQPTPIPSDPSRAHVSMGNYIFKRQPLVEALLADARRSTDHDFGRSIIPEMVEAGRVFGYDFQTNEVPGV
jgi:glucose-1-phosphate adenylyltransferase